MKNIKLTFVIIFCFMKGYAQPGYPATKKVQQQDNYHGVVIDDPYRWLEDDNADETSGWVAAQNNVTEAYLEQVPYRREIEKRLTSLWNYTRYGAPYKKGAWYYFSKNTGLQNQPVWYRQQGLAGTPELFFDANKLSADGTGALGNMFFSKSGRYMAYLVQQAGSDWQEAYVMDATSKKVGNDTLRWLKFTGLTWRGEEGFYYTRYPEPVKGEALTGMNLTPRVYFHKLGTPQSQDELVYEDPAHPNRFAGVSITEDERFLILSTTEGTSGRSLAVKDLQNPQQKGFSPLVTGFDTEPSIVDHVDGRLLMRTNDGAPNYKLVLVDPREPATGGWKTIIPEQREVLQSVGTGGGYLFATYLKDASTRAVQYKYDGSQVRVINLPGIGSASGFGSTKNDLEFFYTFNSYNYPPTIFKYNVTTGASTLYRKSEAKVNPDEYEVKQVFFTAKDGARVPIFLTYKKGLVLNGRNPVLMYGYGGFNIALTPGFSMSNMVFLEQGGVYAVVNLRGGSEYGENWHKGGMLGRKQTVFDDFIGAAEFLIQEKYTNSDKLAISGASNGGLLVGACMVQRPDLFKVALPAVGVLDMLRYHQFTIGHAWAVEYGSSDNADQFKWLYQYSPLHNLRPFTNYPATLITTADHDDRVVPAHSFKFAARLQECQQGANPVLIRIESKAGHGAGKPTSKLIEEYTDMWSFVMYNLGMEWK